MPASIIACPSTLVDCLLAASRQCSVLCASEVARVVDGAPDLQPLRLILGPRVRRAAERATLAATLSLSTSLALAYGLLRHWPLPGQLAVAMAALASLVLARQTSAKLGRLERAMTALYPLAETGPMSAQTARLLCAQVPVVPYFLAPSFRLPLFRAHLHLAHALLSESRQ